ncbi:hypothetical protein [Gaetbulibacter saemankumensis]|uniref:hypothetical protein n=1 Tax=Gaetbulibacter saemankumensis TaxID=311208 RepID=UPI000405EF57|nr:hypothetical protein [Gaetbulibacter saemankumensis]
MDKSKIMISLVLLIYIASVLCQFIGYDVWSYYLSSLIMPVITVLYFISVKKRTLFFSLFLLSTTVSDILVFLEDFIPFDFNYLFGNSLYILAYIFLLVEIFSSMNLIKVIKSYFLHLIILSVLSVYLVYVLQEIVDPYVEMSYKYYVELVYNIVLFLLLSVALLNYFYHDNVKSLYLFFGSLAIVFAEVIWIAYAYISERNLLIFLAITLHLLGFLLYFRQAKLEDEEETVEVTVQSH